MSTAATAASLHAETMISWCFCIQWSSVGVGRKFYGTSLPVWAYLFVVRSVWQLVEQDSCWWFMTEHLARDPQLSDVRSWHGLIILHVHVAIYKALSFFRSISKRLWTAWCGQTLPHLYGASYVAKSQQNRRSVCVILRKSFALSFRITVETYRLWWLLGICLVPLKTNIDCIS